MARKVSVSLVDDIDGGNAERTVNFAWEGALYEIDLSRRNIAALERELKPYLTVARRVRSSTSRQDSRSRRGAAIRQWARSAGMETPTHGRLPKAIVAAYEAQQAKSA